MQTTQGGSSARAPVHDRGEVTVEDVRLATFRDAKGTKAYSEGPVDAYLGRAVEILLAVN